MNAKSNRFLVIDWLFIAFFMCYYLLPAVSIQINFTYALILALAYFVLHAVDTSFKISQTAVYYAAIILFVSLLYLLLTSTHSISADVEDVGFKRLASKCYQMVMMFLPLYLFKKVHERSSQRAELWILLISAALIVFVMILTVRELIVNTGVSRQWSNYEESSLKNVGGYYFVYAIPITVAITTMFLCKISHWLVRILLLGALLFQFYFLIVAQYTLSILLAFTAVFLEVFFNSKSAIVKVVVACVFVLVLLASPKILEWILLVIPSGDVADRLTEIRSFLVSGDASGYNLNGRMLLYKDTIMAFLRSPFWGNQSLDFDGHATFLTTFADLGLLGGIPYCYLYYSAFRQAGVILGKEKRSFSLIFLLLILTGLTNPIHAALPLMYVTWFLAPLSIAICQRYERKAYGIVEH